MIMKKSFLFATAIIALASCADSTFIGDEAEQQVGDGAISFNLNMPAQTRAEEGGATAATALNNQFIIWGEKNEASGAAASDGNLVFENYIVRWTDNSAYTTTSNTKNWEYVGFEFDDTGASPVTTNYSTNITPNTKDGSVIPQTIKYWDYSATSYTFTAVSALPADITDGKVVITKKTSGSTVYDKGYEIAVKAEAAVDKIFIADRNQPTKGTGTNREATNAYGGNVTMKFRNFMSKIRFGLYETIPGYKVNITNVEYNSTGSSSTSKFGVDGKFLVPGANTVFTVTYETGDSPNKAIVDVKDGTTPNDQAYLVTAQSVGGSPILSTTSASPVSTIITTPTYDKTDGAYTTILPYTSNTTSMKVKFDFTLTSEDTGETIQVADATAEIPAAYCQWKSNYAYTYILKINDNTNGQIGGVTGLYPITFDAVQITDENGQAEYITTLSEPSITTFGVKDSKYTTGKNEYEAGSDIYVTVVDGNVVVCPTLGTNINVYKATTTDASLYPITEASVAESIAEVSVGAKKITVENINADDATNFTAAPAIATTVPKEDGTTITSIKCELTSEPGDWKASSANVYYSDAACGTKVTTDFSAGTYYKKDFALKLTGAVATTTTTALVVEYVKTANTYNTTGQTYADAEAFADAGTLYTDADGTTVASSFADDATTYYKRTSLKTKGTYAYKVIRVATAP